MNNPEYKDPVNCHIGENHTIEVTVVVDFTSKARDRIEQTVIMPEKSTVFDALSATVPLITSRKFGMDHFVEAIAGIRNDFAEDRGWHFEVNGYRSNVPAERYLVKDGDLIKWLYLSAP
ncbi:MAG TPA: DUF4430 domain-containing protein [Candidatus Binatia bacterium]|jgi:hypothetical protein|nr:DUF4430 domain-containing protein [Candidatus Binatia bacterium]